VTTHLVKGPFKKHLFADTLGATRPKARAEMSDTPSALADCSCQSGSHDHLPGQCPRIHVGMDGLCDYCRERADADTRRPPSGFGAGPFGSGPFGDVPQDSSTAEKSAIEAASIEITQSVNSRAGIKDDVPPHKLTDLRDADGGQFTLGVSTLAAVEMEASAHVQLIRGIWKENGFDFEQFNEVERELRQIREFAGAFAVARSEFGRSHNNPPELVDIPEIDLAAIDAGLAAIAVIRTQLPQAEPDPTLLELIWRALEVAAGTIGKFCGWITERGLTKAGEYIDNVFAEASKALGKSLGSPQGLTAWGIFICGVANGQDKNLQILTEVVKAVGAALGR